MGHRFTSTALAALLMGAATPVIAQSTEPVRAFSIGAGPLERSLPMQSPDKLTPDFIAAVDDYVEALRGAPPNPALPWTVDVAALTAADTQVREQAVLLPGDNGAARVLVSEIGAITRSLVAIVPSREPTSAV